MSEALKELAKQMGNAGYCNYAACEQFLSEAYKLGVKEAALSRSAGPADEPGFDEATETRWQKAIYEVCKEAVGPEHYSEIDGAGCDSGDALDFTLTEIRQALNFVRENSRSAPDREALPRCEVTDTPRKPCALNCGTYPGNLGPCETWEEGANGRCVYCDHGKQCHALAESPSESAPAPEGEDNFEQRWNAASISQNWEAISKHPQAKRFANSWWDAGRKEKS